MVAILDKSNLKLPPEERRWIAEMRRQVAKHAKTVSQKNMGTEGSEEMSPDTKQEDGDQSTEGSEKAGGKQEGRATPRDEPADDKDARRTEGSTNGAGDNGTKREQRQRPCLLPRKGKKTQDSALRKDQQQWTRLRSYVVPGDRGHAGGAVDTSDGTSNDMEQLRDAVELAGIERAVQHERDCGREPDVLPPHHKGWDIASFETRIVTTIAGQRTTRELARRIEVKATRYEWEGFGVGMTAAEFEAAYGDGETYYLYVVEKALEPTEQKLYVFKNPTAMISKYRFDGNWKQLALVETPIHEPPDS